MRTIIVTGAARGIGRAITEKLLSEGCRVIGTYFEGASEATSLLAAHGPDRMLIKQVDLSDRVQTKAFIDFVRSEVESIEGMVFNAGVIEFALLPEMNDDQWDRVLEVNLTAPWVLAKGLCDKLAAGGAVVAISSTDAFTSSYASIGYTVSKPV